MRAAGFRCARLDINYFPQDGLGGNYFDILSPAGFAYRSQFYLMYILYKCMYCTINLICGACKKVILFWNPQAIHGINDSLGFRLCISTILQGKTDDLLVLLGMKCSSWSRVNIGTSLRAICCPSGDITKVSVRHANCMAARIVVWMLPVFLFLCSFLQIFLYYCWSHTPFRIIPWSALSIAKKFSCKGHAGVTIVSYLPQVFPQPQTWPFARTILLILLVSAIKGTWLLEQPFQSMLRYYGRFRHLTYVMKACLVLGLQLLEPLLGCGFMFKYTGNFFWKQVTVNCELIVFWKTFYHSM